MVAEVSLIKVPSDECHWTLYYSDDKSTLVQVMAWCRQTTSHYLGQCWPRSMSPNGVTRPQWVNNYLNAMSFCTRPLEAYHLKDPGMRLNTKTPYYQITRIDIPIIKIRRSHDRIIFIKRPPRPGKTTFILDQAPVDLSQEVSFERREKNTSNINISPQFATYPTTALIVLHFKYEQLKGYVAALNT